MNISCRGATDSGKEMNLLHRRWTQRRELMLLDALREIPKGALILDAGCGHGTFSELLYRNGYKIMGIDISSTAINQAATEKPGITFKRAPLDEDMLFIEDEYFSAVWCSEVLEHIIGIHSALKNINRVLVQGGLLVLTTPYHSRIKNLAIALFGFERHYDPYSQHIRFFTKKSLTTCLENAGFRVESSSGIGRIWPFYMSIFVTARKVGPAKDTI